MFVENPSKVSDRRINLRQTGKFAIHPSSDLAESYNRDFSKELERISALYVRTKGNSKFKERTQSISIISKEIGRQVRKHSTGNF